jgi:hypothetical protein
MGKRSPKEARDQKDAKAGFRWMAIVKGNHIQLIS